MGRSFGEVNFGGKKQAGIQTESRERTPGPENQREKLKSILRVIAERYREEGLPMDDNCRIDMRAFMGIEGYPARRVEADLETVRRLEAKYATRGREFHSKYYTESDQLEALAAIVFTKCGGKNFFAVRSAPFDDFTNNIDTILIDRKTGMAVCALDEVRGLGDTLERKRDAVMRKNAELDVTIRYGITPNKEDGGFVKGELWNVPVLYLPLPREYVRKSLIELKDADHVSEFERKIFTVFIAVMDAEVKKFHSMGHELNPRVMQNLEIFEEALERLKRRASRL